MSEGQGLTVRSHVGRDLLQSAQLFNTDRKVVWEYVINSLQYVDADVSPEVSVTLRPRKKSITVIDNGRGMDWNDLQNDYFVMHGENIDRKKGRPGRGFFGTGKCAAFGIADKLRLRTIKDGKRSTVELTRVQIEEEGAEHGVPLLEIEREVATDESNGTRIDIEGVRLGKLDANGVIEHIERNLAFRRDAQIYVNGRLCEYVEPDVERTWNFCPTDELKEDLGDVALVVKKSFTPLDEAQRGIAILANGVLHEITLGTSQGKDMSQYLFGHIDVPAIDEDKSTPAPFTMDRSGKLNKSNRLIQKVFAFIDPHIADVRQELVAEARERRQSEEAKKLREEADRIAQFINEDFKDFRSRLSRARAKARGDSDAYDVGGVGESDEDVVFGDEIPATLTPVEPPSGSSERSGEAETPKPNVQVKDDSTDEQARPGGGTAAKRKTSGGFSVEFEHQGPDGRRTKYISETRTIYVNLDHPQMAAARGDKHIESADFKRLAYEVAFSEYSVAIAQELADSGFYLEVQEALFDIRERIDSMARKTASIYCDD